MPSAPRTNQNKLTCSQPPRSPGSCGAWPEFGSGMIRGMGEPPSWPGTVDVERRRNRRPGRGARWAPARPARCRAPARPARSSRPARAGPRPARGGGRHGQRAAGGQGEQGHDHGPGGGAGDHGHHRDASGPAPTRRGPGADRPGAGSLCRRPVPTRIERCPTSSRPIGSLPGSASRWWRYSWRSRSAVRTCKPPAAGAGGDGRRPHGAAAHGRLRAGQPPRENFERENLANTDFTGARLASSNFTRAILTDADFTNADLSNAILVRANAVGATFQGAEVDHADLVRADMSQTDFTNATLSPLGADRDHHVRREAGPHQCVAGAGGPGRHAGGGPDQRQPELRPCSPTSTCATRTSPTPTCRTPASWGPTSAGPT